MAKTIVLFSTKGGVGKTLISANLAVAIAEKKKVLLIDADLDVVGDAAKMLNLNAGKSLVDVMYLLKKKREFFIDDFIVECDKNLSFISAILKPQEGDHFDPSLIKNIFPLLQDKYDYIIIDGGGAFSESLVRFFDEANLLLMITTPDILSVYQTKWALDTLQSLNFPLKMTKVILNRAESLASINWREIQTVFPCEIIVKIPSEGKIAMLSINKKVPLIKEFPSSRIAVTLKNFAKECIDKDIFLEHQQLEDIKIEVKKKEELWKKMGLIEMLGPRGTREEKEEDQVIFLKQRIHQELIKSLDLKRIDLETFSQSKKIKGLREQAERFVNEFLAKETHSLVGSIEIRKKLSKEIIDEALGLGPLEDLLRDEEITDIMVNNKNAIFIEKKGKIELTTKRFISNEQLKTIIDRIIAPLGRRIDESSPYVDARLPDGSRVNAIIPPLSLTGYALTIRKFRKEKFISEELVTLESLTAKMGKFLEACVLSRKNMIVSGGTGSGKTSVLNVLSSFIPDNERIITIEDAAELKLDQIHWVRLEARPPNIEGKGAVSIRELFRNSLRMRPDRIIIGECRGAESLDMLQAMNTGHDGSMTTVHANSTGDIIVRLDSMILMSGVELPIRALREMIASAIDLIIHTARLSDGSRKIVQITELAEMRDDMHINLRDIFAFQQKGVDSKGKVIGEFKPTGYIPTFFEDIKSKGISISKDIFQP